MHSTTSATVVEMVFELRNGINHRLESGFSHCSISPVLASVQLRIPRTLKAS
jgi:hypothetical protein